MPTLSRLTDQAAAPLTPARSSIQPEARPDDQVLAAELPRRSSVARARRSGEVSQTIVGREVTLSGEIVSCDKLIIDGSVKANLTDCLAVDIAESGLLKGSAAIEAAEIAGRFEGKLTVRKRLWIKASGRVTGTIRYGHIEIEHGGQISGDVRAQQSSEAEARPETAIASARSKRRSRRPIGRQNVNLDGSFEIPATPNRRGSER